MLTLAERPWPCLSYRAAWAWASPSAGWPVRSQPAAAWGASPPPTQATGSRLCPRPARQPPCTAAEIGRQRRSQGAREWWPSTPWWPPAVRRCGPHRCGSGRRRGGIRCGPAAGAARHRGKTDVAIAPIVSSGRAAKLILRRWAKAFNRTADFVVIEGCKAGGHLGFSEEELLAWNCQTLDEILPEVLAEVKPFEAQFGHDIPVLWQEVSTRAGHRPLYRDGCCGRTARHPLHHHLRVRRLPGLQGRSAGGPARGCAHHPQPGGNAGPCAEHPAGAGAGRGDCASPPSTAPAA